MTEPGFAFCRVCRTRRDVAELLAVVPVDRPAFAVCRPSVSEREHRLGCFRLATRTADLDRLAMLGEYLAALETVQRRGARQ